MEPVILDAQVMHARPGQPGNVFRYGSWYLGLPLGRLGVLPRGLRFAVNRPALVSLRFDDYGAQDGSDPLQWILQLLDSEGVPRDAIQDVVLFTMPRVLGFGFNPVNFWMCVDAEGVLRTVLCEVNNTYGETHCYLCRHADGRAIESGDRLLAGKCFYVSPFLERNGQYEFRFALSAGRLDVGIRHLDDEGNLRLSTSLRGELKPFTRAELRRVFWSHLAVPLKTWLLIHWQALKLNRLGHRFRKKPEQLLPKVSLTKT